MAKRKPKKVIPSKGWKAFELRAARAERAFQPERALVMPNDYIEDLDTGKKRQVDASIRQTAGTVPLLMTMECRKRRKCQDVTWIEQLVSKRQSVGAAATIAVSSSPLSPQAVKKAARNFIQVRQLTDVPDGELRSWVGAKSVTHTIYRLQILSIKTFQFPDTIMNLADINAETRAQIEADPINARVYRRKPDGAVLSAGMLLTVAMRNGNLASGAPSDGRPFRKNLVITVERGLLTLPSTHGPVDIAGLVYLLRITGDRHETPVGPGFRYVGAEGPAIYGAEAHSEILGMPVVVSFHKREGEERTHVSVDITTKDANSKK